MIGCALLPVMLLIGFRVTLRIAGPAYRINKYLQEIIQSGTAKAPCKIRKDDELQALVESLNAAVQRIEHDRIQNQAASMRRQAA